MYFCQKQYSADGYISEHFREQSNSTPTSTGKRRNFASIDFVLRECICAFLLRASMIVIVATFKGFRREYRLFFGHGRFIIYNRRKPGDRRIQHYDAFIKCNETMYIYERHAIRRGVPLSGFFFFFNSRVPISRTKT